ncbi:sugar transferase [Trichloromonas sp.]|uniref:sugar transferase n=1 Tax=Trichloromonas sp. TaxID=3069249 RepID=UPI002A38E3F1|nr:sugar transferase [Trichloromonas sp.]
MDKSVPVGVLGASSLVGGYVLDLLLKGGRRPVAFSRQAGVGSALGGVDWRRLDPGLPATSIAEWICVAPVWVLPEHFSFLEAHGVRRIVALSSTSLFSKKQSADPRETAVAARLAEGERALREWAESRGIEWVILRPTLIYGRGRDKNIAEIARFVRRFGFFPLFGAARGLRQPIHGENVAEACLLALNASAVSNRAYNISGGETLSYRDMVTRVFHALGHRPRLLSVPLFAFDLGVAFLRLFPRFRHWSPAMARRMNEDLVFDHDPATSEFGFSPRSFILKPQDVAFIGKEWPMVFVLTRFFDILFALFGLIVGFPLLLTVALLGFFDTGSPIFFQERVGRRQGPFILVKFRTMCPGTASVATHLAGASAVTPVGRFLRRTKLDELPQLWNVLKGEMSFVGPRPCLYNQQELIDEREKRGVYAVRPGITGLAQIRGIDMSTPELLAETDARMIAEFTLGKYFTYILRTVFGEGSGDRIRG